MTTIAQQMDYIITNFIENDWPGAGSVTGYYDPTTMIVTPIANVPAPVDYALYEAIKTVLETEPIDQEFNQDMTSTEKKSITQEVIDRLTKTKTRYTTLLSDMQTYHDELPS